MSKIIYYSKKSPYQGDVTKNENLCKHDFDNNFFELKSDDITELIFNKESKILTLKRNKDNLSCEENQLQAFLDIEGSVIFNSLELAKDYALNDNNAYVGQLVIVNSSCEESYKDKKIFIGNISSTLLKQEDQFKYLTKEELESQWDDNFPNLCDIETINEIDIQTDNNSYDTTLAYQLGRAVIAVPDMLVVSVIDDNRDVNIINEFIKIKRNVVINNKTIPYNIYIHRSLVSKIDKYQLDLNFEYFNTRGVNLYQIQKDKSLYNITLDTYSKVEILDILEENYLDKNDLYKNFYTKSEVIDLIQYYIDIALKK